MRAERLPAACVVQQHLCFAGPRSKPIRASGVILFCLSDSRAVRAVAASAIGIKLLCLSYLRLLSSEPGRSTRVIVFRQSGMRAVRARAASTIGVIVFCQSDSRVAPTMAATTWVIVFSQSGMQAVHARGAAAIRVKLLCPSNRQVSRHNCRA